MKLNKVLKDSFNVTESQFNDETRLINFAEWDSMTHMFFITKLEEEYSIEVSGEEIATMQTVGDIKKIIVSKGKAL
ncbi:MAG TPA: acyl carrier protein [Puia sp.]|jgi:acyl carrier protein|nr:acyl carrier protein [Puia sp.]